MRFLFVTYCFGNAQGQALIGVYKRGLRVALELCRRGHEIAFCCPGRENFRDEMTVRAETLLQFVDLPLDDATGEDDRRASLDGIAALRPDAVVVGEAPLSGPLLEATWCAVELGIPLVVLDNAYQPALVDLFCQVQGPMVDGIILTGPSSFHAPDGPVYLAQVPPYIEASPLEAAELLNDQLGLTGRRLVTVLAYDRNVEQLGASLLSKLADPDLEAVFLTPDLDGCRRRLAERSIAGGSWRVIAPAPERLLFGLLQLSRLAIGKCAFMQVTECLALHTPIIGFYFQGDFTLDYIPQVCRPFACSTAAHEADSATVAAARRLLELSGDDMAVVHNGELQATAKAAGFLEVLPRRPRPQTTAECERLGLSPALVERALRRQHPHGRVTIDLLRAARVRLLPGQQVYGLGCHYAVDGERRFARLWARLCESRRAAEAEAARASGTGRNLLLLAATERLLIEEAVGEAVLPSLEEAEEMMRRHDRATLPRIPVLNYHHVHDEAEPFFRVTPAVLRQQLEQLLSEGYRPISPDQLGDLKGASALDERSVLVSFDDAYEDFLLYAWPVLREFQVPTTLFVVADHIGGWNDWDPLRPSRRRHLTLDQLKRLRDEGVTIGCHSRSHRPLVMLDDADLLTELRDSQRRLETELAVRVRAFAYPGGHVDRRVRDATELYYDLGFATTVDAHGWWCDPFLIPRFDPTFFQDPAAFRRELQAHCGAARGAAR